MDEFERVARMVADGRITAEEGDRLIAVLRTVHATGDELENVRAEFEGEASGGERVSGRQMSDPATPEGVAPSTLGAPAHPSAPLPPLDTAASEPVAPAATPNGASALRAPTGAPTDVRWLRIEALAGDLDVSVDPSIAAPAGRSGSRELRFEETSEGHKLIGVGNGGSRNADEGWLPFGNVLKGDFSVTVPHGYGVELAKIAGDIDIDGVEHLRGSLAAGDLTADSLRSVDFSALAGDVKITLLPTSGAHRVQVKAGDLSVALLPGSNVSVSGGVSLGDAQVDAPLHVERHLVSQRLSGSVGGGTASLELKVTAGNIRVRVSEADE